MSGCELILALQHIYSDGKIWGGEFLCRVKNESGVSSPQNMLEKVRSDGKQYDFDLAFIDMALQAVRQDNLSRAFINIHPETLNQPEFPEKIFALNVKHGVPAEKITLEITEESPISNWQVAFTVLQQLKNHGYKIAIDDFGCAYSNIERLLKLYDYIDYIKIDNSIHSNNSLVFDKIISNHLPDDIKHKIIAERIECHDESSHLNALGIVLHQGFLYHMPTLQGVARKFPL